MTGSLQKILVSSCLLGMQVRYDGGSHGPFPLLQQWQRQGRLVAICPEVAGGLPTPRAPAEITGGKGAEVVEGRLPVLTIDGRDVTCEFVHGAEKALERVRQHGIRLAVLKARSPSCGNVENYDGTFSGTRVAGEGVTAALLRHAGVQVFNETQLAEAAAFLAALEA